MSAFLEISDLSVAFRPRSLGEWLHRRAGRGLRAVNGLSLSLERGDSLAIIGERGCGKNRLVRALLRLTGIAAGDIHFDGQSLKALRGPALMQFRRRVQLLSHDPVASLNPRLSVAETLAEPLQVHRLAGQARHRPARRCADGRGGPASRPAAPAPHGADDLANAIASPLPVRSPWDLKYWSPTIPLPGSICRSRPRSSTCWLSCATRAI